MLLADPPSNSGFTIAAYAAVALVLGIYASRLMTRVGRVLRETRD